VGAIGEIFGVYREVLTEGVPPKALPASAPAELLEALRTGQAVGLIRESVRMVLQELVGVEASEVIGAAGYERSDTRINERTGSRPRMVATQAGDIDLRNP
jgi:putative transposase